MLGIISGAVQRIKEIAKECSSSHCMLHRQALVARTLSVDFKNAFDDVKIINFIKALPLNNGLFKILCDDMGSVYSSLFLHTEIRWLYRGRILTRFLELRNEVRHSFLKHNFNLSDRLTNKEWLFEVAYLGDIFAKLNDVNLCTSRKPNQCIHGR